MKFERIEKTKEEKEQDVKMISLAIGVLAGFGGWRVSSDVASFFVKEKRPLGNLGLKILQLYFAHECANRVYQFTKGLIEIGRDATDEIKKELEDGGSKD